MIKHAYSGEDNMAAITQDQILEAIASMTVLEASELVKAMEEKFGVTAAVAVAAAPGAAAGVQLKNRLNSQLLSNHSMQLKRLQLSKLLKKYLASVLAMLKHWLKALQKHLKKVFLKLKLTISSRRLKKPAVKLLRNKSIPVMPDCQKRAA